MPAALRSLFVTSLSIAMDEPNMSGLTKGIFKAFNIPCNVPSSPDVSWMIGKAALEFANTLFSSGAITLTEFPLEDK